MLIFMRAMLILTGALTHSLKSVQILVNFRIQSEYRKIRTRKNSVFGHFSYLSVFSPNAGKYGPEKTPYLDTFRAVIID